MSANSDDYRVISRDVSPDHRIIAVVRTGGDADDKTDDEILDALQHWERDQRHLRAVDDE